MNAPKLEHPPLRSLAEAEWEHCHHCGNEFEYIHPDRVPIGTMCGTCFLNGHRGFKENCAKCKFEEVHDSQTCDADNGGPCDMCRFASSVEQASRRPFPEQASYDFSEWIAGCEAGV